MNQIEIRESRPVIEKFGLHTFEILIDGTHLAELLEDENEGIPVWLAKDGIPTFRLGEKKTLRHIITVCACGEYGCGSSSCEIIRGKDSVVFHNFDGDCGGEKKKLRFEFDNANFNQQVIQMKQGANKSE